MAALIVNPAIGIKRCPVMVPETVKFDSRYSSMNVRLANSVLSMDTLIRLVSGPPKYLSQNAFHLLQALL